jgi:hypothetical protein
MSPRFVVVVVVAVVVVVVVVVVDREFLTHVLLPSLSFRYGKVGQHMGSSVGGMSQQNVGSLAKSAEARLDHIVRAPIVTTTPARRPPVPPVGAAEDAPAIVAGEEESVPADDEAAATAAVGEQATIADEEAFATAGRFCGECGAAGEGGRFCAECGAKQDCGSVHRPANPERSADGLAGV